MDITIDDVDALAIGATVLGSGGGADPTPEAQRLKERLMDVGSVSVIALDALLDDELVAPLAFMGAPIVSIEKLASGKECSTLLSMVQEHFSAPVRAVAPCEIGGSNAFVPLIEACINRALTVVDADMIGRAFPELQMSSCALAGIACAPAFLCDAEGNRATVLTQKPEKMEAMCRALTCSMGSNTAVSAYIMRGRDAKRALIPGTITRALKIGKTLLNGGFLAFEKDFGAKRLASGVVVDVEQEVRDGFLFGNVCIQTEGGSVQILFQNEYLFVCFDTELLAATPDIIVILEKETSLPLSSERLCFGQQVVLFALDAPSIWKTREGLSLVGPQVFKGVYDAIQNRN